jgi:hypothetical protein
MRKPRTDSHWNHLTSPQRELLEKWLFDEHLSYEAALERVKTEFGQEASRPSLARYYQRRARERQMEALVEAQSMADVWWPIQSWTPTPCGPRPSSWWPKRR